jgi:NADPH:quinone reductase-like Zn-dependent oxidoreductase
MTTYLSSMCEESGQFDAVIDCHGSQELWKASEKVLKAGVGHHYATVGPKFPSMSYGGMVTILWQMLLNSVLPGWMGGVKRSYKQAASFIDVEKLGRVRELAEEGIIRPHIGGRFAFEDAIEVRV